MLLERALPDMMNHFEQLGQGAGPFGHPLPPTGVPLLVRQLAAVITRDGVEVEGIFRRAGT